MHSLVRRQPSKVYEFLRPIANSTCQGYYACNLMMLGGMPAAMNGAAIQIWGQKPSPLVAAVLQIAGPQAGKSRLLSVLEEWFDSVDDVVAEYVQHVMSLALRSCVPNVLVDVYAKFRHGGS